MVWLASYPKSGNTWFRILIANLGASAPVDINDLPERGGIASSRALFDGTLMIPAALLTHEESDRMRPSVYAAMANGYDRPWFSSDDRGSSGKPRFVKTHDAYTHTSEGVPLLGTGVAQGAILLVRDPRDVAVSLAHHIGQTIDHAIEFMARPDASFGGARDRIGIQLRQQLPGWSGFYRSWIGQQDIPVHIVRYEDLHARALDTIAGAFAFAGITASEAEIELAWRFSNFRNLHAQEAQSGFKERARSQPGPFFRRGMADAWRDELSSAQAALVCAHHGPMMEEFGYRDGG